MDWTVYFSAIIKSPPFMTSKIADKHLSMKKHIAQNRFFSEILPSFLVLALLLAYTVVYIFGVPYSGFYFNPTNGEVLVIYTSGSNEDALLPGDIIQQVGAVTLDDLDQDASQTLLADKQPGETVQIVVLRNNQAHKIDWTLPGFNTTEFKARAFNIWWLAYVFWFFGMLVQLFVRPKDMRSMLLLSANYLTAFWIICGVLSASRVWGSSLLLHATTWLLLPVYLHFHWVFPRPLKDLPRWFWVLFYAVNALVALGEIFQVFPASPYPLAFAFLLLGSMILLLVHYLRQPAERGTIKLLVAGVGMAVVPSIVLGVLGASGEVAQIGPLALLALPAMPGAYFYAVHRRQLGGLELRANKLVSIYAFLVLLGTVLVLLAMLGLFLFVSPLEITLLAIVLILLTAVISILGFPPFQAFVEQRFLGIQLPYQNLQDIYSEKIVRSTSLNSLLGMLRNEVLPSLLVQEFAFIQNVNGAFDTLMMIGIQEDLQPQASDFLWLVSASQEKNFLLPSHKEGHSSWARLLMPLRVGETTIGFWLFGRRDPDDLYPQTDLPVFQTLANQTAIALSNLLQTESLRTIYQANIDRYEEERLGLALDLHDSVLNQMAALMMHLEPSNSSPAFLKAYDDLSQRLREIVSDLRPPMLGYGLKAVIDELADNLMERSKDTVKIAVDLQTDGSRYPEKTELHVFRIVQEACENALRHAHATHIEILGHLFSGQINLILQDDGVGFDVDRDLHLDTLIANKHFGLVGMIERATLVGAEIKFTSAPRKGTEIVVKWSSEYTHGF